MSKIFRRAAAIVGREKIISGRGVPGVEQAPGGAGRRCPAGHFPARQFSGAGAP